MVRQNLGQAHLQWLRLEVVVSHPAGFDGCIYYRRTVSFLPLGFLMSLLEVDDVDWKIIVDVCVFQASEMDSVQGISSFILNPGAVHDIGLDVA